ncbi:hypothetical protein QCA50_004919 [Cerrena zonata]|uniref:Pinin/SDK/MemA protein domain-containing protein n=1 Tax=Cerrena zonata TaxID=2478898 RepID=A0AAW0GK83_9APHY
MDEHLRRLPAHCNESEQAKLLSDPRNTRCSLQLQNIRPPQHRMSTDEQRTESQEDIAMQQDGPSGLAGGPRKRPRIDMATEPRERKRGKTMFGLVLGTLKKAKNEDKERNASDAARKRQEIEQRLQDKLRKETDTVRRAEEAKKDKTAANRKEEELQLKDSIYKLRRKRLPLLSNFLSTADRIPTSEDEVNSLPPTSNPLAIYPKSHPPPLYYLPAILTPAQEAFLKRRKAQVEEAAEKEWTDFKQERQTGVDELTTLRQRVAEEDGRQKAAIRRRPSPDVQRPEPEDDVKMGDADSPTKEPSKDEKEKETEKAPVSAASSTTAPSEPSQPSNSSEKEKDAPKKEEEEEGAPGLSATPSKESAAMDVDDEASKKSPEVKTEAPVIPQKVVEKAPEPIKEPAPPAAAAATDEDDAVEY